MTIDEAIETIEALAEYSGWKNWPQNEQDALKYAANFMRGHKKDDDGYDYSQGPGWTV